MPANGLLRARAPARAHARPRDPRRLRTVSEALSVPALYPQRRETARLSGRRGDAESPEGASEPSCPSREALLASLPERSLELVADREPAAPSGRPPGRTPDESERGCTPGPRANRRRFGVRGSVGIIPTRLESFLPGSHGPSYPPAKEAGGRCSSAASRFGLTRLSVQLPAPLKFALEQSARRHERSLSGGNPRRGAEAPVRHDGTAGGAGAEGGAGVTEPEPRSSRPRESLSGRSWRLRRR
jgi:hypothetical protein